MHNFFVFSQQTEKSLLRVTLKKLSLKREIVPLYTTLPTKYSKHTIILVAMETMKVEILPYKSAFLRFDVIQSH